MPLTKHRTLSGSCLVSAWLNSGEQLSADTKQDGDGQLTQSEESARNLTEEVIFCMEFELTGIVLLAAIATSLLSITHHPLYFSPLDSSIQVKATVRQQGFADYKGEAIITTAFYLTAKNINRKAFIQFFVEFVTRVLQKRAILQKRRSPPPPSCCRRCVFEHGKRATLSQSNVSATVFAGRDSVF